MEAYRVSCEKNTGNENSSVIITRQNRLMPVTNCSNCVEKKSSSINNQ